jgi:hypothetical protein
MNQPAGARPDLTKPKIAPDAGWLGGFGSGVLSIALALVVLGASGTPSLAQKRDVPIPRVSPLKATAAPGNSGEASGDVEPTEGEFLTPEADLAAGALPAEGDSDPGIDAPLSLAPDQPIDLGPRAGDSAQSGFDDDPGAMGSLTLDAKLFPDGPTLAAGVAWRVFAGELGPDGHMQLLKESQGGPFSVRLKPGTYFVHAAYGRAGATRKVILGTDAAIDTVILNAGGLRLAALVGKDQTLPSEDVSFDIYAPDEGGSDERILIVSDAPPMSLIGLNAGTYHVVCRYGDANAIVRADIRVEAGKITDAAVYQKAARLTLKLVEEHGGEALANTSWSVVTTSGDVVSDAVGAFPSVVLAAGEYTAIARHEGKLFERNFTVEAGLNRDVEVLLAE